VRLPGSERTLGARAGPGARSRGPFLARRKGAAPRLWQAVASLPRARALATMVSTRDLAVVIRGRKGRNIMIQTCVWTTRCSAAARRRASPRSRDPHSPTLTPRKKKKHHQNNSLGVDARVALMAANEVAQVLEGDAWRQGVAAAQSDVVDAV
jgi:hypothetical protein